MNDESLLGGSSHLERNNRCSFVAISEGRYE